MPLSEGLLPAGKGAQIQEWMWNEAQGTLDPFFPPTHNPCLAGSSGPHDRALHLPAPQRGGHVLLQRKLHTPLPCSPKLSRSARPGTQKLSSRRKEAGQPEPTFLHGVLPGRLATPLHLEDTTVTTVDT